MHALQGSLLRLEQMRRFDITSPLDVIQTLSQFSGLKAAHKLFGRQTILRLKSPQAAGSAVQAQLEHLQFRADIGLQKWFEIEEARQEGRID